MSTNHRQIDSEDQPERPRCDGSGAGGCVNCCRNAILMRAQGATPAPDPPRAPEAAL